MAATLVAALRHVDPDLTPNKAADRIAGAASAYQRVKDAVEAKMRSAGQDGAAIQRCLARLDQLKKAWIDIADRQTRSGGDFAYANDEPVLKRWLDSSEILAKAATLRDRERREAERFNRPPIYLGAAYWALHSLSHAFMAELALECGYPLSSLKERIYSSGPAQPDRFGLLIYTSTAGGQGTLGGLSSMAERVGELLDRATKRLALCSNDPICAEHADGSEDYALQGAACHACLLICAGVILAATSLRSLTAMESDGARETARLSRMRAITGSFGTP